VQELLRVLFEALEKTLGKAEKDKLKANPELTPSATPQATLINHLYQGKMADYIRYHSLPAAAASACEACD
jgi:hypothetical protein